MTYYQVSAQGLLNSAFPWSNNAIVFSTASEAAVAAAFNTAYRAIFTNATLAPYIPTTVEVTETSASTMSPIFTQTTKTSTTATTAGTGTDGALGYRVSEVITFRTAQATRWGRGRWFFPSLGYNALAADGFTILAAAQTALQDGLNAYFTAVGSTYDHQILHRKATAGGLRAAYSLDSVVACDIPNTFANQRRRADKVVPARLSVTL
jgi:hypothetical protein